MRVIYPNLSFEDSISGRKPPSGSALQDVVDSLVPFSGLLGNQDDVVVVAGSGLPAGLPPALSHVRYLTADQLLADANASVESISVVPWGWDHSARQLAAALNPAMSVPSQESILEVNSRRFSAAFDTADVDGRNLPFDGTFGALCSSEQEFQEALHVLAEHHFDAWIAKPAWSAAGRGRLSGRSGPLNSNQRGWLSKQFQQAGYVWLEPWLPVVQECGVQLQISPVKSGDETAEVEVVGVTGLLTDGAGRYRGSLVSHQPDPLWQPTMRQAIAIGQKAGKMGYFGPLGVDSMQVVLPDGQQTVRLCHDINGRLTMGRLALQFLSLVRPDQTGLWLQSAVGDSLPDSLSFQDSPSGRGLAVVEAMRVSPQLIGGRPPEIESWFYVVEGPQKSQNPVQLSQLQAGIRKDGCDRRGKD